MGIDMRCRQIQKMLAPFQDGELGEKERRLVAAHLKGCETCRAYYEEMEVVWQAMDGMQEIEPSPGFYRDICKKINAPRKPYVQRLFLWIREFLPVPAIAIPVMLTGILLGVAMGNLMLGGARPENNPVVISQAFLEENSLGVFAIAPPGTLGDGYLRMASLVEDRQK